MTTTHSYSIIVNIPKKTDVVFLAIPFSTEFDALGDLIRLAVADFGLTLSRLEDPLRSRATSQEELFLCVRSARLIIAVCSPEPSRNQPDPNVMYELGLAHAIAKPAIIITNEARSLPRDLRVYDIVLHDDKDTDSHKFVVRLRDAISKKLQTSKDGIIDGSYAAGISVSTAPHFPVFRADLWENFVSVLSAGLEIQRHFDFVQRNFLDGFVEKLRMMFLSRIMSDHELLKSDWDVYRHFEAVNRGRLDRYISELSRALSSLQADVDLKTYVVVNTSKQIYFDIKMQMDKYVELHHTLEVKFREQELSEATLGYIYSDALALVAYAMRIGRDVVSLNLNTIRIVTEQGTIKEHVS